MRLHALSTSLTASLLVLLFIFPTSAHAANIAKTKVVGLSFSAGGTVAGVYVYPGQKVTKGDVLIALDSSELVTPLDEASATVDYQQIKLEQLEQSLLPSSTDSVRLQNNQDDLMVAQQNAMNALHDSFTKTEDAVRNRASQVLNLQNTSSAVITSGLDQSNINSLTDQYNTINVLLTNWQTLLNSGTSTMSFDALADAHLVNLGLVGNFLDTLGQTVNTASFQAVPKSIRTDIYTGRANVLSGINEVISMRSKLKDMQKNVAIAQATQANTRQFGIELQKDVLRQARDKEDEIQARIDAMTIRAPQDGTVIRVHAGLGEYTHAHMPVIYMRIAATSSRMSVIQMGASQMATVLSAFESLIHTR